MPANSVHNIIKNQGVIRKLMNMDASGEMNSMLENAVKSGAVSYSADGVSYNGVSSYADKGEIVMESIQDENFDKSNMPKAILESFKKNPGMVQERQMPASVLDEFGLGNLKQFKSEGKNTTPVNESTHQTAQSAQVDYSLLRTIINEAVQENVKKYISALSKKLMSESVGGASNTVQAVKIGEKFSFITENGDVYEATLKYKTNINEKVEKAKGKGIPKKLRD